MTEIGMWMEVPIKKGTRSAAAEAATFALEKAREDDGTVLFVVNASESDPDLLLVYELYRDQAALDNHNAAEWLPTYLEKMGAFVAGEPRVHLVRPLVAKGI
jgi:quinol monooxygenase YgiN